MNQDKFYTIAEVAKRVGVHADTLRRWVKTGKIPEPSRDRNDWRVFTEAEVQHVERCANTTKPSAAVAQTSLLSGGR